MLILKADLSYISALIILYLWFVQECGSLIANALEQPRPYYYPANIKCGVIKRRNLSKLDCTACHTFMWFVVLLQTCVIDKHQIVVFTFGF